MSSINRRKFRQSSAGAGLLIVRHSQAQMVVFEGNGQVAMGYKADHTTVDVWKWAEKAGPDGTELC